MSYNAKFAIGLLAAIFLVLAVFLVIGVVQGDDSNAGTGDDGGNAGSSQVTE